MAGRIHPAFDHTPSEGRVGMVRNWLRTSRREESRALRSRRLDGERFCGMDNTKHMREVLGQKGPLRFFGVDPVAEGFPTRKRAGVAKEVMSHHVPGMFERSLAEFGIRREVGQAVIPSGAIGLPPDGPVQAFRIRRSQGDFLVETHAGFRRRVSLIRIGEWPCRLLIISGTGIEATCVVSGDVATLGLGLSRLWWLLFKAADHKKEPKHPHHHQPHRQQQDAKARSQKSDPTLHGAARGGLPWWSPGRIHGHYWASGR